MGDGMGARATLTPQQQEAIGQAWLALGSVLSKAMADAYEVLVRCTEPARIAMRRLDARLALSFIWVAPSRDGLWHVGTVHKPRQALCGRYRSGREVRGADGWWAVEPGDRCRACNSLMEGLRVQITGDR